MMRVPRVGHDARLANGGVKEGTGEQVSQGDVHDEFAGKEVHICEEDPRNDDKHRTSDPEGDVASTVKIVGPSKVRMPTGMTAPGRAGVLVEDGEGTG